MKIVITGALGHIGSQLLRSLPKYFKNLEITLIDNLFTQRFCSLYDLPTNCSYKFINKDLKELNLNKIFKKKKYIIHLAAITDATWSIKNSKVVEDNNYISTKLVAKACAANNCKLISLSSTSVYGTKKTEVDESCSKIELKPQSPYANIKLKEEKLLKKMAINNNLKFVTFRFGTIFGVSRGMRFHTAVNKFCWQAAINQPMTVWKTAYNQKRPYLALNDAIASIAFAIKKDIFDCEIYNILTGNYTVKNIIDIIKINIRNSKLIFVENKIMNQLSYEVLNKKFIYKGFKYKGNLKFEIKKTITLLKNLNN